VKEFWHLNCHVLPNENEVMCCCISEGVYETRAKHIRHVTQVEMLWNFMESNANVKIFLRNFLQLKPWYVEPIIIHNTYCYRYHEKL